MSEEKRSNVEESEGNVQHSACIESDDQANTDFETYYNNVHQKRKYQWFAAVAQMRKDGTFE